MDLSIKKITSFCLLFTLVSYCSFSQEVSERKMKKHVRVLSSDKLEGRLPGTRGEELAQEYIIRNFKKAGLKPPAGGYLQPFEFNVPPAYGNNNYLRINGRDFVTGEDYYPIIFSGNGEVSGQVVKAGKGIIHPAHAINDYEGVPENKILLIDLSLPQQAHPHSSLWKFKGWRSRIEPAMGVNPVAIIFYNWEEDLSLDSYRGITNYEEIEVPVLFVSGEVIKETQKNPFPSAELSVDIKRETKMAENVVGLIDNGAEKTVVLGAHYDHLGHGEYGSSRYVGDPAIHNGADDNASGVSMILELARVLAKDGPASLNYLVIAFSAEELGLLGSNYFTQNSPYPKSTFLAMLNFDMVGRLDEGKLGLNGVGTAKEWDSLINLSNDQNLDISPTMSGIGSSDHTSFTLESIPVLHFFTGIHEDYHKPSDDFEKINFRGMEKVAEFALNLSTSLSSVSTLDFVEVEEETESRKAPRFKVTLGIVPDYFYKEKGIRIDGVTPGKPASEAGLQKGDIIIRVGETETGDMYGYMEALTKYEKGDNTRVVVIRDGKEQTVDLTF